MSILIIIVAAYLMIGASLGVFGLAHSPKPERTFRSFSNIVGLWPAVFLLGREIDEEINNTPR